LNEQTSLLEKEIVTAQVNRDKGARSRRGLVLGLLLAAVVLVAGGLFLARSRKPAPAANAAASATATPEAAIEVTSAAAITRNLQRSVEVVGSLAADEEVVVSAQAAGELTQLNVDFGSFVTQGQVIGIIDQRDAKLRVEQAEAALKQTYARLGMKEGGRFDPQQAADVRVAKASLDLAKVELDRQTRLIENGDISRAIYDQAQSKYRSEQARYQAALDAINQQLALVEQQQAALALARKTITDTVVRAPITGAVKEKTAARGTYLAPGGKIVSLVKINPLRLRADIPEYAAAIVRRGQTMKLNVEAVPDRTFSGRVVRIGPSLNEQTRALTVEAQVANPGNILRPGMFAKSQLITAPNAPALMVPQRAIANVAGLSKVFVIENGKVSEREVQTGTTDGELIEIKSGVREGEVVATSNLDKLSTGSLVKQ
jgi:RND family efflux transporter MFP subunit